MGFGTPKTATTGAFFGEGVGPVWLDDVKCTGTESMLKNCPSKTVGTSTCSHAKDAGVICNREIKVLKTLWDEEFDEKSPFVFDRNKRL